MKLFFALTLAVTCLITSAFASDQSQDAKAKKACSVSPQAHIMELGPNPDIKQYISFLSGVRSEVNAPMTAALLPFLVDDVITEIASFQEISIGDIARLRPSTPNAHYLNIKIDTKKKNVDDDLIALAQLLPEGLSSLIIKIHIVKKPEVFVALGNLPRTVVNFKFSGYQINMAAIEALTQQPLPPGLKILDFSYSCLKPGVIPYLIPKLPEGLNAIILLGNNDITDDIKELVRIGFERYIGSQFIKKHCSLREYLAMAK